MSKRKSLPKKLRFEVFKRDSFTCQYCGRSAPDALLQVDHIQPVSKDGDDDMMNLITACADCNAGKSDRELSDDTAMKKQKRMLDDLQERRDQLEMMLEWQHGLVNLEENGITGAAELWSESVPGYHLNDNGLKDLRTMIRKFGLSEVIESMRISTAQYLEYGTIDGQRKLTPPSVEKAFDYIGRICACRKRDQERPYMRELYYIRGIMRKRLGYVNDWECIRLLEKAYKAGCDTDELKDMALDARNWTEWCRTIEARIADADDRRE